MPTPAYTELDNAGPDGSAGTGSTFSASALANVKALRDMAIGGRAKGFLQTRTQGTGPDLERPQFITWLNATLSIGFRKNITWTTFAPTTVQWEWSNDNGTTWAAMGAAQVNTFDAVLNLTGSTSSGGFVNILLELWAKLLKARSDATAHSTATGTAVHGLGSMATQTNTAVNIDGGTIDGCSYGSAVRGSVDATRVTEGFLTYTPAANGAITLDWSVGGAIITTSGANTLNAFINVGTGVAGLWIEIDNFNAISSAQWSARVDFGTGGVPSITGPARVGLGTRDGAATLPKAWIIWQ